MKKFIKRTSVFLLLTTVLLLAMIFVLPEIRSGSPTLAAGFNEKLKQCDVIVAGDSRAARQVDPAVIHKETGLPSINMAADGWDIYSLSKTLKYADVSGKTIILSVSFSQVSDGAIASGYFSPESFMDLKLMEKISLYRKNPEELLYMQSTLFRNALGNDLNKLNIGSVDRQINVGFDGHACKPFVADDAWFRKHPWYRSPNLDGYKRKLLVQALDNLSKLDCKVLLYNGPVSQPFVDEAQKNGVYELEKSFDRMLDAECRARGIQFHSFLDDTSLRSPDLYYDPQHLCGSGNEIFTRKLVELVRSE
jgi:hypothetical protein